MAPSLHLLHAHKCHHPAPLCAPVSPALAPLCTEPWPCSRRLAPCHRPPMRWGGFPSFGADCTRRWAWMRASALQKADIPLLCGWPCPNHLPYIPPPHAGPPHEARQQHKAVTCKLDQAGLAGAPPYQLVPSSLPCFYAPASVLSRLYSRSSLFYWHELSALSYSSHRLLRLNTLRHTMHVNTRRKRQGREQAGGSSAHNQRASC